MNIFQWWHNITRETIEICWNNSLSFIYQHLHVTVPSSNGKRILFNRTTSKFFFDTVELSWMVEECCSTMRCSCFCLVLFALWVLCVLCSRYSSEAWNIVSKTNYNIRVAYSSSVKRRRGQSSDLPEIHLYFSLLFAHPFSLFST